MQATATNGTVFELTGRQGAPVVALIHGLGLTRETWTGILPALSARYTILNYDLAGHGQSAPPKRKPDLALYAEQLRDLMDELGIDKAALAGFSLGGMINRRFAMDHPERVSALAILNSPHERGPEAQKLVEQRAAETGAGGPGATLDATIERWFTPQFRRERDDVVQRIRRWVLANDPVTYAQCRQVLANGVIELIRPDPPITHPVLVITCENDSGSTPAMSRAIASEIAGAEAVIIPGLQHLGLIERTELFARPLMSFLASHLD